jgi:hypothetical protein
MLLIGICLIRSAMKMRTFPDFGLRIMGFLRQGMSVEAGRAAGNPSHGEAGRGCQDPGLARLNYPVLVARGQAIFYGPSKIVQVSRYSVSMLVFFLFVVAGSGGNAGE